MHVVISKKAAWLKFCPGIYVYNVTGIVLYYNLFVDSILIQFDSSFQKPCHAAQIPSPWRHNGRYGVSNHQQPHHCLLSLHAGADQRKHQSSASLAFVMCFHPLQIRITVVHAAVRGHRSDWSGDKAVNKVLSFAIVPGSQQMANNAEIYRSANFMQIILKYMALVVPVNHKNNLMNRMHKMCIKLVFNERNLQEVRPSQ